MYIYSINIFPPLQFHLFWTGYLIFDNSISKEMKLPSVSVICKATHCNYIFVVRKIFTINPIPPLAVFASSSKGPDVAATDIRLRLSPLVYSSVQQRRRISEYRDMDAEDRELDLKQTIYDEPHRPLGLGSLHHANILKSKNKSCDVLCQYENFCHIREPGPMNNFGSTPLFNIFTVDQPSSGAGAGRPRAPPPTSYSTTNFKDSRYPAGGGCYDYSTPLRIDTHSKIAASESDVSDTFYAASDILNVSFQAAASGARH